MSELVYKDHFKSDSRLMLAAMRCLRKNDANAKAKKLQHGYEVSTQGQTIRVYPTSKARFVGGEPLRLRSAKVCDVSTYNERFRQYINATKDQTLVPQKIADACLLVAAKLKDEALAKVQAQERVATSWEQLKKLVVRRWRPMFNPKQDGGYSRYGIRFNSPRVGKGGGVRVSLNEDDGTFDVALTNVSADKAAVILNALAG